MYEQKAFDKVKSSFYLLFISLFISIIDRPKWIGLVMSIHVLFISIATKLSEKFI